ncbi:hypothetical protein MKW98_013575 [Papaver atlanticum]|uniref:Uncharacterized protein n=1 Tax=Papaver atlanticum TaxID=357466 RepID=A0AAD4XMQ9_9MAGN|nr:hypothetical protein MKW98_013575 [Papaver atlanticum]
MVVVYGSGLAKMAAKKSKDACCYIELSSEMGVVDFYPTNTQEKMEQAISSWWSIKWLALVVVRIWKLEVIMDRTDWAFSKWLAIHLSLHPDGLRYLSHNFGYLLLMNQRGKYKEILTQQNINQFNLLWAEVTFSRRQIWALLSLAWRQSTPTTVAEVLEPYPDLLESQSLAMC